MAIITLTNTLQNGPTHANDADEVMENFNDIVDEVNGNLDVDNMDAAFLNGFLKLLTVEDIQLAYGTLASGTFNSAIPYSQYSETVAHGLGRTPKFVLIMPTNGPGIAIPKETDGSNSGISGTIVPTWWIDTLTSTNFTVHFTAPGVSNNSIGGKWIAVG